MSSRIRHLKTLFPAIIAMAVAGAVIADLNSYMSVPGRIGMVPDAWPAAVSEADSRIALSQNGWTFVLTAHPGCPCTRASVDQLIGALSRTDPDDRLIVLVRVPAGAEVSAETLDLGVLEPLRRLPIARFIPDPDSSISTAFGGLTSGFLIAFGADGKPAFAGGVTPRRGMVGPAEGVEAIEALVESRGMRPGPASGRADVFGCPLCEPTEDD